MKYGQNNRIFGNFFLVDFFIFFSDNSKCFHRNGFEMYILKIIYTVCTCDTLVPTRIQSIFCLVCFSFLKYVELQKQRKLKIVNLLNNPTKKRLGQLSDAPFRWLPIMKFHHRRKQRWMPRWAHVSFWFWKKLNFLHFLPFKEILLCMFYFKDYQLQWISFWLM
jgi:hypothetical protein